jgi:hypothetical protein
VDLLLQHQLSKQPFRQTKSGVTGPLRNSSGKKKSRDVNHRIWLRDLSRLLHITQDTLTELERFLLGREVLRVTGSVHTSTYTVRETIVVDVV